MKNLLDKLEALDKSATAGPWEYQDPENKADSSIIGYEPFTDGSEGKGFSINVICRDSGVYPPDGPTADLVIAMRNNIAKLIAVARAAQQLSNIGFEPSDTEERDALHGLRTALLEVGLEREG